MKKLFLHGFMGRGDDWDMTGELTPDLPCFGFNEDIPKSRDDLFRYLYEYFCEELQFGENDWIIGYSMGGRVAMELVYRFKLPVAGCIIFCAHPGLQSKEEKEKRKEMESVWSDELIEKNIFLEKWYKNPMFQNLTTKQVFKGLMLKRRNDPGKLWIKSFEYYSLSLQPDLRQYIKNSTVPLYYFAGTIDKKFHEIGRELALESENVTFLSLEGIDHGIPWQVDLDSLIDGIINK